MKAIRTAQEAMLFGGLHCRRDPSGASCSGDTFRIGSSVGQCSKLLTRLLAPILIVIVVLGLAVRPYAVAKADLLIAESHEYEGALPRFHLMLQPMLAFWFSSTGRSSRTASTAARKSFPVSAILLPGRLSSS